MCSSHDPWDYFDENHIAPSHLREKDDVLLEQKQADRRCTQHSHAQHHGDTG